MSIAAIAAGAKLVQCDHGKPANQPAAIPGTRRRFVVRQSVCRAIAVLHDAAGLFVIGFDANEQARSRKRSRNSRKT